MADYIDLKRTDPERVDAWLEENQIVPAKLSRRLFHSVLRQIFEDNFFHADLHLYNVILLRNNWLGVIDCRTAGQLETESLAKHRHFIEALAEGEYGTAAEYSFLLEPILPRVDLGEVKAKFIRVWRLWDRWNSVRELPIAQKSLALMLDNLNRIMHSYHFETQWSMSRFKRTLVNADVFILHNASYVNYLRWLRQYFRAANRRSRRIKLSELEKRAVLSVDSALKLPKTLSSNSIVSQEALRRAARVIQGSVSKSGYLLATIHSFLSSGLLRLVAFLICAFLSQFYEVPLEPVLGPQITSLISAVPRFELWQWIVGLLAVLYGFRRTLVAKRQHLQPDIFRRSEARPGI
jgi:ubiquinone biosynthesis protein